jgi:hypothetical protein
MNLYFARENVIIFKNDHIFLVFARVKNEKIKELL